MIRERKKLRNDVDDDSQAQEAAPQNSVFITLSNSKLISYYLSGEIIEPENYINVFQIIRSAGPNDLVKIHINSSGGLLSTAIQFMRVLLETQATVIASVEGDCCSAATMIMLAADEVELSPHSTFLFHNYSGGAIGKGGELFEKIEHLQQWSSDLFHDVYNGFLSESEIQDIMKGKDIWMSAKEVKARIDKRNKRINRRRHT